MLFICEKTLQHVMAKIGLVFHLLGEEMVSEEMVGGNGSGEGMVRM
jgi:hypothetical protein